MAFRWYKRGPKYTGLPRTYDILTLGGSIAGPRRGGFCLPQRRKRQLGGVSTSLDLWYSYFDGANWGPETQVKNVGMSGSPSAVVVPGDGIYVFHQGPLQGGSHLGDAQQLWWSHFHFDNSTWDPDTQVMGVGMSEAPSAVVV